VPSSNRIYLVKNGLAFSARDVNYNYKKIYYILTRTQGGTWLKNRLGYFGQLQPTSYKYSHLSKQLQILKKSENLVGYF